MLYAILYGSFPFNGETIEELELAIQKGNFILTEEISIKGRDLLQRMLNNNPSERITIKEIYMHPWLAGIKPCIIHINILVCLFNEEELSSIRKDYDFKERQKDNSNSGDSSIFTIHNLDTENNEEEELNKSIIMAPYNTNESDEENFIETVRPLILNKRIVKFSSKLRKINREYERNNNSNIDNGIYLKPVSPLARINCRKDSIPKTNQINKAALDKMEDMGFDKNFVLGSINANRHNSATTCYYLLSET